ncbi:hypothetical protein LU631_10450 [Erwinia tracheiphila]|uniref:Uncharacterized protein n=1 Tax=Erwinia tracheiphila TaxID=65700 RepID=A0A0M2KMC5_9GAMM|nr:hypothetical protein [Erwinia tracheiphila]EOS93940.1 hypothetical protein ETR_16442 [Erwinia tracheiphila PSU-1]KKF38156.1 hypothetical protein SY86_01220 [Erwinia tracheiphila]UIA89550.1 hypothetical protein LU631_10450 [Erwinia tracheiphila]UIA97933.1 hypothetical protein LU633_09135 [Erwinia tracheiphila]
MGQHLITSAAAGKRLRDDYGATAGFSFTATFPLITITKKNARLMRSFPVVQSGKVETHGRLNNVA